MSQKRLLGMGLAALIVIGLLIMGGTAIYRSGWSQGYTMGQLAASSDGGAVPYAPYYRGYPGQHFRVLPFLCTAGLFVLGLAVTAKIFRVWAWKKAGGPGEDWPKHWRHHGPFWHRHWEKPPQEKPEPATPEAEADEPEAEG